MSQDTEPLAEALGLNDPRAIAEITAYKRAIGLGFDVEAFMGSDIGRYFQLRASHELEETQEALVAADASDIAVVRELQLKARVAQRVLTWFAEAVAEGENAERQLQSIEASSD